MITIGIIAAVFVLLFLVGILADELPGMWRRFCDWLWDVQTAYYKFRLHRKRRVM